MLALLSQVFALLAFVWAFRRFVSKRGVGNVPGPKAKSFAKGNMAQMFDPSNVGWQFASTISKQYGRIARLWGPFGAKYLEIYDPKAIRHVLVKVR
ncbi:hypothetical protein C0993_005326 [Termitomyces sp. T159_Od127]|nr:hypothetical protein C0993_005326 [Termitomyces sp. T159_Od127]